MVLLAQSAEISEFFKILGPALLSAALRSLLRGTVVLGIGCNHARHRSPAAAYLAAHWLRQHAACVELNMNNIAKACQCYSCMQGTHQAGFESVFDHCKTTFYENFKFKGRTNWLVAVPGVDNSGFSRADACPQYASPLMLQQVPPVEPGPAETVVSQDAPSVAPGTTIEVSSRTRESVNARRTRSRSPVPHGGHLMPQGDLASAPLASSSLTVQPQSFDAVISAAIVCGAFELRFLAAQSCRHQCGIMTLMHFQWYSASSLTR